MIAEPGAFARERFPARPGCFRRKGNMSETTTVPESRFTRVAIGVTLAIGLLATAAAALPIGPKTDHTPKPVIATVDSVGINVLEPARAAPQSTGQVAPSGNLERQVQNWVPTGTGGGTGVHGSPKG